MKEIINNLSEQDVIKELRENGIEVIMKPVALIPNDLETCGIGDRRIATIQTDIYEALNRLKNRSRISIDPFS